MNDAENATVNDARTTKVQVRSLHTTVSIPANAEASLICTSWIAPANIAKDIYGYRDKKVGGVWGRRTLLHYGCVARGPIPHSHVSAQTNARALPL